MKISDLLSLLEKKTLRRLIWGQFSLLVALAITTAYFSKITIEKDTLEKTQEQIYNFLKLAERDLKISTEHEENLCQRFQVGNFDRITLINHLGKVICDTRKDPSLMENHLHREEIQMSMKKKFGHAIRKSQTLREKMIYVAIRISYKKSSYFLRKSISLKFLQKTIEDINKKIFF